MSILKFDDISIETPYKLMSIIDIKLNHGVLIHSTLEIEAICEEESFDSFFKTTLNDSITLKKEDKIIFKGMIGSYDANKEGDVYSVYIKAVSATSLLDSKVESKSFQDTTMTYSSVIDEVIKDVRDSAVSFNVENKEIKEPLIMYNETAWEFVNRLASHFNTVLVADIKENKPRFYFGFKDKNIIEIEDSKFYKSSKDLKSLNLSTQKLIDTDFFSHEIKSKEVYELQDKVKFKHKTLYISHIKGEFIKSELIFTYKLSRINGIRQNKIYNENIKGVSLEGKVIDSKEEFVKLHLNIDKKQDAKKAHWFRVGAISNNVFYLMFEKNTYARLYFPSNKEVLAEVKNSVRKNGSTCPLTKKPENRYLTTKDKNQISLKPKSIEFKSNEGLDLSILMEDKKGTVFKSNSQINLNSKANISFNAKNKVNIKASEFVLIYNHDKIKPQSLTIENEFHFIGDKINLEGTDRTAFKMYNDDPKLIPIKERKPKTLLTNPMKAAALASAPNNLLAGANSNQLAKAGGANGAKGGNTPAKTNASKAGAKSGSASNKFSGKFILGAMLVAAAPIVGCVAGPAVMFGMIAMGCALMRSPKKSLPKPPAPKKLNLLASGKNDERYSSSMDEQTDEELWEEFLILKYGLFSGAVKNGNLGRLKKEEILEELERRLKERTIEKTNVFNYNMAKINAPKWREESLYTKFIEKNRELDFKLKLGMYSMIKVTNDMLQQAKEEKNFWNTPIFDLMGNYLKDVSKRNIEDIQNGNMSYIERVTKESVNGKGEEYNCNGYFEKNSNAPEWRKIWAERWRKFNEASPQDKDGQITVLNALYEEYKYYKDESGMDATVREIHRIQKEQGKPLKKYSFASEDITTVVRSTSKIFTKEDIDYMHREDTIFAYSVGFIPYVGIIASPLVASIIEKEQKGNSTSENNCKNVAISGVTLIDDVVGTSWATVDTIVSVTGEQPESYKKGEMRIRAEDSIITIRTATNQGMDTATVEVQLRNGKMEFYKRYGLQYKLEHGGRSSQYWEHFTRQCWKINGYK